MQVWTVVSKSGGWFHPAVAVTFSGSRAIFFSLGWERLTQNHLSVWGCTDGKVPGKPL
jgi:hypothetical protein